MGGRVGAGAHRARDTIGVTRAELAPHLRNVAAAGAGRRLADFAAAWETTYPAIVRLWERSWAEMVPFLAFDREIRTIICTTNAIESIYAHYRRAANASGHFPNEQAALKRLCAALVLPGSQCRIKQRLPC